MIKNQQYSSFLQSMELFNDINDFDQFLDKENFKKLDCSEEKYQDLENKYSDLNETYTKEIENSKKVEKCLLKCLKFYSKLSKKYEIQQKLIGSLKETIQEKKHALEESLKTQEKLKGLLQVYMRERSLYSGESNEILRRDKEILLDVCCRLISESVKSNNIKNITNLILKKFKKDLDDEKLNLLKSKEDTLKKELNKIKGFSLREDLKPGNFLKYGKSQSDQSVEVNWGATTQIEKYNVNLDKEEKAEEKNFEKILVNETKELNKNVFEVREKNKDAEINDEDSGDFGFQPSLTQRNFSFSKTEEEGEEENSLFGLGSENVFLELNEGFKKSEGEVQNEALDCDDPPRDKKTDLEKTENNKQYESDSSEVPSLSRRNSQQPISRSLFSPDAEINKREEETTILSELKNSYKSSNLKKKNSLIQKTNSSNKKLNRFLFSNPDDFLENKSSETKNHEIDSRSPSQNRSENLSNDTNVKFETFSTGNILNEVSNDFCATNGKQSVKQNGFGISADAASNFAFFKKSKSGFETSPSQVPVAKEGKQECFGSLFSPNSASSRDFGPVKDSPSFLEFSDSNDFPTLIESERNKKDFDQVEFLKSYREDESLADLTEEVDELDEKKLLFIFKEMEIVRLLSPIEKDESVSCSCSPSRVETNHKTSASYDASKTSIIEPTLSISERTISKAGFRKKRIYSAPSEFFEFSHSNKKFRAGEKNEPKCNKGDNEGGSLLDSIMSAMTIQKEEFKVKLNKNVSSEENMSSDLEMNEKPSLVEPEFQDKSIKNVELKCFPRTYNHEVVEKNKSQDKSQISMLEKLVMEEIKTFVSMQISTKEEAEKNVQHCISMLKNRSEEIIARTIVAIVFENVDETIEIYERPAPPLTRTQHRLMVLLSVLKTLDPDSEKILSIIHSIIPKKLFPDKFFWPDDCVEMATRFYAALCRTKNDAKSLWHLCLRAMTEMKQRCCLVAFTALKTWPDVLHVAPTHRNNIMAITIVNLFLHMPKSDGRRNLNQKKKLMALKHLLINFYQFKIDDTIESFVEKVFNMLLREENGSEKALALLAKSRDLTWTSKNVFPKLKELLRDWCVGKICDAIGNKILSVIKQISKMFLLEKDVGEAQAKNIISLFSEVIDSRKLNHDSEVNIIEILLEMKQYAPARKVIREWVPKMAIDEELRNEIINISAESVFCDLKLNNKKHNDKKKNVTHKFKKFKKKTKKENKNKKKKIKSSNGGGISAKAI